MKRLIPLPRSLTGQFTLLLSIALLAVNIAAFLILSFDRGREVRSLRRHAQIERLTTLVPALNALAPELRNGIVKAASGGRLHMRLDHRPLVDVASASESADTITALIKERLGVSEHPGVRVRTFGGRADQQADRNKAEFNVRGRRMRGVVSHISIQMADGSWLNAWQSRPFKRSRLPGRGAILTLLLSFLAVLAVGLWYIRRLILPLRALSDAADRVGRGDLTVEVPEVGAIEIEDAARAFNTMQSDISRFDKERARTVAAIGHDLRTPITSLRLRAEMVDDEGLRNPMIRTLDEMSVMADGLLYWGRTESEQEALQDIDLTALVRDMCENSTVRFVSTESLFFRCRPVALRRAFANLIENTNRYAGEGTASLSVADDTVIVTIEDEGPGIPEDQLQTIFSPFERGDDSRSPDTGGHGLGLSIVESIVRSHGGTISLQNRIGKPGLIATVSLPVRRPDR